MHRCNTILRTPWVHVPESPDAANVEPLCCELDRNHGNAHTDWIDSVGFGVDVWALWDEAGHVRYAVGPSCNAVDPTENPIRQTACTLPAEHACGHSWQFADELHG